MRDEGEEDSVKMSRSHHSPGRKQLCYHPRTPPWLAEEQAAPITEHFYSSTSDELINILWCRAETQHITRKWSESLMRATARLNCRHCFPKSR